MRDDVAGLAAEIAYKMALALFPFLMFLAALGGFVSSQLGIQNPAENVAQTSEEALPRSASALVAQELRSMVQDRNPGLLSGSLIAALLLAATGINAIIKAANRAYEVPESRPWLQRYLLALTITAVAGVLITVALALTLVGQIIGSHVAQALGLEQTFWTAYSVSRWPAIVLLVFIAVAILYRLAPNVKQPIGWITPGAVVFVLSWIVGTNLFSQYVATSRTHDFIYGTAGGMAILLIWFYMVGLMLLVGLEINQAVDRKMGPGDIDRQAHEVAISRR